MNSLFFKLALRNIFKNKAHNLINLGSLSIGIAVILFIFLFLKYETSFDDFHPEGKRIYRIMSSFQRQDNGSTSGFCSHPVASDITSTIPGIDDYCRVSRYFPFKGYVNNQVYKIDRFRFAEKNFFDFFNFKLLAGNPATALDSPEKIVLTQEAAKKIFGNKDPMGQTIGFNKKLLTVSGIAENLPANTHLRSDALASIKYVEEDKANFWLGWGGGMQFLSYLKLNPAVAPEQIEARLPELLYEKINQQYEQIGWKVSMNLQNIRDVHLTYGENHYDQGSNRDVTNFYILISVGGLILLLALINYINLYSVQKSCQLRDVSLLKIHGAEKLQLTGQTFVEVFMLVTTASLAGMALLHVTLPHLNGYLKSSVALTGEIMPVIIFLTGLSLLLSLVVTILSTWRIFRTSSVTNLVKPFTPGNQRNIFANALVTFQFAIVILLLTSGLFIAKQNTFLLNKELGFDKENILYLGLDQGFRKNELQSVKQQLKAFPEIASVCLSSQQVGSGLTRNGYGLEGIEEKSLINVLYTDHDFLDCYGVRLNSGRNFKDGTSLDKKSVLINKKLAEKANWQDPLNKVIERNGNLTVIGTVENFNFTSLHKAIEPLIIMSDESHDGWGYYFINIRYHTSDIHSLVGKIQDLWKTQFPNVPYEVGFLEDRLEQNYALLKAQQTMIRLFTSLAILIACMGLFALSSFVAQRHTKEIGIRKVNGAKVSEIMQMLNKDFLKWVVLAFILACPLAYFVMAQWLESFAYQINLSWWIFAAAGLLATVVALLTVSWQSWKAATRNPIEALRYE